MYSKDIIRDASVPDLLDLIVREGPDCLMGIDGITRSYLLKRRDDDGHTVLHHAAVTGQAGAVLTLLPWNIAVDVTDDKGRTPLMLAAYFGHADVMEVLLKHGADPGKKDNAGYTVRKHAEEGGMTYGVSAIFDSLRVEKARVDAKAYGEYRDRTLVALQKDAERAKAAAISKVRQTCAGVAGIAGASAGAGFAFSVFPPVLLLAFFVAYACVFVQIAGVAKAFRKQEAAEKRLKQAEEKSVDGSLPAAEDRYASTAVNAVPLLATLAVLLADKVSKKEPGGKVAAFVDKICGKMLLEEVSRPDCSVSHALGLIHRGADLSVTDKDGNDALMLAAYHGHESVVAEIAPRVENPERKNNRGISALDWAGQRRHRKTRMAADIRQAVDIKKDFAEGLAEAESFMTGETMLSGLRIADFNDTARLRIDGGAEEEAAFLAAAEQARRAFRP